MQITHEEAHKLIQFKADQALNSDSLNLLNAHLKACAECTEYSFAFQGMEKTLKGTMQKHWYVQPLPLSMDILQGKLKHRSGSNNYLGIRRALAGFAVMAFVFAAWQFTLSGKSPSSPVIYAAQIPTPSLTGTSTQSEVDNCKKIEYEVRPHDTLESLAQQFLTSKEEIRELNNLFSEDIQPAMKLLIPVCDQTPTGAFLPPTFTITPSLDISADTPG